jgi:hypothetical protein
MWRFAIGLMLVLAVVLACSLPGAGGGTPTRCPEATPELLAVDPVPATTDQTSVVVMVFMGNGESVTIETESGTFTHQGEFSGGQPAEVEVTLTPGTTHHLEVTAAVKQVSSGGCSYGGYTLSTTVDRNGAPLVIEQTGG